MCQRQESHRLRMCETDRRRIERRAGRAHRQEPRESRATAESPAVTLEGAPPASGRRTGPGVARYRDHECAALAANAGGTAGVHLSSWQGLRGVSILESVMAEQYGSEVDAIEDV